MNSAARSGCVVAQPAAGVENRRIQSLPRFNRQHQQIQRGGQTAAQAAPRAACASRSSTRSGSMISETDSADRRQKSLHEIASGRNVSAAQTPAAASISAEAHLIPRNIETADGQRYPAMISFCRAALAWSAAPGIASPISRNISATAACAAGISALIERDRRGNPPPFPPRRATAAARTRIRTALTAARTNRKNPISSCAASYFDVHDLPDHQVRQHQAHHRRRDQILAHKDD